MMNAYAMMQQQEGDAFSRQMQEKQWAYQQEQDQKAAADAEYQKKLAMAQLKASYGDLSGLKELGIDTSRYTAGGGSGGGVYRRGDGLGYGSPVSGQDRGEGAGGLGAAAKNELTMLAYDNGGYIPADVWASYAAQYGEAALIAAGFKKQAAQSNPGSGNGGGSGSGGSNKGGTGGKKFAPIAHG